MGCDRGPWHPSDRNPGRFGPGPTPAGAAHPAANPSPAELAPVPNKDIEPPAERRDGIVLRPQFYPATRPDPSQGFAPGSRHQAQDEQRPITSPGLRLTVPLR